MKKRINNVSDNALKALFLNLFLLPVYPDNIKPSVLGLFLIASIFFAFKNKATEKPSKPLIRAFLINISIFLILGLSLLYSENSNFGAEYLLRVSPLLLFPLSFLLIRGNKEVYTKNLFFTGKLLFYCSTFIFFTSIFLIFYWRGNVTENFVLNYSHRIIFELGKYSIHPIYASLYIGIALVFSISLLKRKKLKLPVLIGNGLLLLNLIILSRKSMILILALLCIGYFIYEKRIHIKWKLIAIISFLIVAFSIVRFVPEVSNRFKDIKSIVENTNKFGSSNLRVNIYQTTYKLIKEKPILGYGVGDSMKVLSIEEDKEAFFKGKNYNTHNQFLGFTLSVGILGLLVFIVFLGHNLRAAILSQNFEHVSILLVFILLMLIENILDRQNGVMLFSFYINYLMFYNILSKR